MRLTMDERYETMPWDAADAVVFDVGNVLLGFRPDELLREILPGQSEAVYARLHERIFETPYWAMMDRGTATGEEAAAAMSAGQEALRPLVGRFMAAWNDHLPVIDEGVEALRTCKARGKRCYVLSNYAAGPFDVSCRKHPELFGLFDGMLVSAKVGLLKPDEAIYRLLIDTFSLDPTRTLFIDDTSRNVEAALHCGMQALHFHRPGQLAAFFR